MSNYSFKPLGNNKYEMLYNGDSFGITFITPDEYSMDDYKNSINFSEVKDLKVCKDVVIRLKNEPEKTRIKISSHAGVTFEGGLSFCVEDALTLDTNIDALLVARDGVGEISSKNLMIYANRDFIAEFYPTPQGALTRESEALSGHYKNGESIFFANQDAKILLQDKFASLNIGNLKSGGDYTIELDCISNAVIQTNVANFYPLETNSKIKFNTDILSMSEMSVLLKGDANGKIPTFESEEREAGICNTISMHGDIEIHDEAHIATKTKSLIINQKGSSPAPKVTFKGKNNLNAKEVVVIYDGKFDRASIKSDSERLSIIKQCMVTNSTICVKPMSKQGLKDFELRNFDACNCVIDNVTGNISHSIMRNTTITNSAFFNNAKLVVGVRDRQGSEHSTSINNLTLKKNTTLILQSLMNGNNKRVLNNSIVEEGEILVTNKNGYEINNSLLNNGKIELNNEENMVISNSNIKGKIYLQNISGIDCAILENSTIVASKSMPIEDAEIKEKNIQDYYLYQKSFRNHIEQEQKDIGKADAQNWEVL